MPAAFAALRPGLAWPGSGPEDLLKRGDMRWFRRAPAASPAGLDPGRQEALVQDIRRRFGAGIQIGYRDQVAALVPVLHGDDGLCVAVRIVHQVAEEAHAGMLAQAAGRGYVLTGRTYRPLWQQLGPELRSPLFALPSGFHPYIHLAAAAAVIDAGAQRCVRLTDPVSLLAHIFEVLDLTTTGWEFGRVPVDLDAAHLVAGLIGAATQVRAALGEEPPPLPPPIRLAMRRNNTTLVYDRGGAVIGGINLGAEMRQSFLA